MIKEEKIINADGLVMGRLASVVAQMLLKNEKIMIVNAEKSIITGKKEAITEKFVKKAKAKSKINTLKGPKISKMPDRMLRLSIKGMLPMKKARGREAFHRLMVYIGVPEELRGKDMETVEAAKYGGIEKSFDLQQVSGFLGRR